MIEKFKTEGLGIGFDFDVAFQKDKKVYCLIGKNGVGKTQLLENMAKSLLYTHAIFQTDKKYKFSNYFMQKGIYEILKNMTIQLPLGISVNNLTIKDKNKDAWKYSDLQNIYRRPHRLVCDKPVVFIGAQNRGFTKNIDPDHIKILGDSKHRFVESFKRTMAYLNGKGLVHEEVANWFVSRLIINPNFVTQSQNKINEVVTVLKLMETLEPSLKLVKQNQEGGYSLSIVYHEGKLWFANTPFDKLSTGFVSVIKIFQEIVAGYGGWSNLDALNQVDGIVFIDEIEPHLHIGWQTKIINILKSSFPNTTFYISTHSPMVLSSLTDGEAYEMYLDNAVVKTKTIEHIQNYFFFFFFKEFFGVDLNKQRIEHPDVEQQKKARQLLDELLETLDGEQK